MKGAIQRANRPRTPLSHFTRFKQESDSIKDFPHALMAQRSDALTELRFVHREYLRDVDDASPGEVGLALGQKNVSRRLRVLEVRGQGADDDRVDAAAVENIVLNDDVWMSVAGPRTYGLARVHPVDVALVDHHCPCTNFRCVRPISRKSLRSEASSPSA